VFRKFNKYDEPLQEYCVTSATKNPFNLARKQSVTLKDSLIDPHLTIMPYKDPVTLDKDPGYEELGKRNTVMQDLKSKVIKDYRGRIIIKIDESHGLKNAQIM
jgi:hypothetical protein